MNPDRFARWKYPQAAAQYSAAVAAGAMDAAIGAAPERQEITFQDGSAVWLLRDDRLLRQPPLVYSRLLALDDGTSRPVDLVRVAPELQFELPAPTTRDAAAAVFHSLRKHFTSAEQFREAVGAAS